MKKFIIFIIAIVSMSAACFTITYVINNVKTYDFYVSLDGNDYIIIEGLEICDFSSDIAYGILLDSDENNDIYDIM